jgi:cytosine/adenosine deaminase-related metal-dependent hydrolase
MTPSPTAKVAILRETGTNVVHCPAASMRVGAGVTVHGKFPEMVAAGVNVCLGSDSGTTTARGNTVIR